MSTNQMLTPCDGCHNSGWCQRYGCTIWNDESRERYARAAKRAKESNDEIDALEKLLAGGDDIFR